MSFIVLILLMVLIFGSVFDSLGAGFAFTIGFFILVFIIGLLACWIKEAEKKDKYNKEKKNENAWMKNWMRY